MAKKLKNKDLAKKLGVSGTLVSLVLNNKGDQYGIKKETQEKVFFLAKKMGYFNDAELSKPLPIEEKPGIIGMVVPSLNDSFVCGIIPLLQKAFSGIGFGFSIISKDTDDTRYDRMIGAFKRFYSALILVGDAADETSVRALRNTEYPFIILDKTLTTSRINTIDTDMEYGAELVKKHIESLGYKNILIVGETGGDKKELSSLVAALLETETQNKPVVVEIERSILSDDMDIKKIEPYLRPPYRIDLVITMKAETVYPLVSFLWDMKIRVPNDIALISMKDGTAFELMSPSVTALKKPLQAMALKAVNMLWTEIKNSGKSKYVRQVNLNPELVIRSSCGSFRQKE